MKNGLNTVLLKRRHHNVNMVRHHTPRLEIVTVSPEEKESLLDDPCQSGEGQEEVAHISRRL